VSWPSEFPRFPVGGKDTERRRWIRRLGTQPPPNVCRAWPVRLVKYCRARINYGYNRAFWEQAPLQHCRIISRLSPAPCPRRFLGQRCTIESHLNGPLPDEGQSHKKARPVAAIHYRKSVRIRSNLDIKLGRVIGGWQWQAADRRCTSRCGHSSRRAGGLGVAFVGALCRRIDSQGVDPRSLNWKISSPGKARDRSPAPKPCTTLGRPLVSPGWRACWPVSKSIWRAGWSP
jgi:hypothetical protein